MNKKLEKQLYDKYPKIFAQKDLPMTQTCMCWGIDTEKGWYWLIDQLCSSIQSYIDNNPQNNIQQVECVQLKEKFGSMRFYYDGGDETIHGMVWLAEHMSYHTCEYCGCTKNVRQTSGWIKSLCTRCYNKYEKKTV